MLEHTSARPRRHFTVTDVRESCLVQAAKASKSIKEFDARLIEYAKRKEELRLKVSFDAAMAQEVS